MKQSEFHDIGPQLRQQAGADNTGFSPILHERIMQALRAGGLAEQEEHAGRWRTAWRIGARLGLAAAIALAAWIILKPAASDQKSGVPIEMARQSIPSLPDFVNPFRRQVATPAAAALEQGKFAYLDRDAERLVTFVTRQLPSFASEKQ